MTSSNGNIVVCVTCHLCGEFTGSPHKGQWHTALMFSLNSASTNGRANNQDAGQRPFFHASVRISVRLSHPFSLCFHHNIIMKLSGVITYAEMMSMTQFTGFRTVTPVWIHIWHWNIAQSLMWLRGGALLFLKVIRQISKSHSEKTSLFTHIGCFWTVTQVWIHQWLRNDVQHFKRHRRGSLLFFKVSHQISRSHGQTNHRLGSKLGGCRL